MSVVYSYHHSYPCSPNTLPHTHTHTPPHTHTQPHPTRPHNTTPPAHTNNHPLIMLSKRKLQLSSTRFGMNSPALFHAQGHIRLGRKRTFSVQVSEAGVWWPGVRLCVCVCVCACVWGGGACACVCGGVCQSWCMRIWLSDSVWSGYVIVY